MREVIDDGLEVIRIRVDVQGVDSAESMGSELKEWVARKEASLSIRPQFDWGRLRAFEVDMGFFGVRTVKISPQRGTRRERLPPSPTHVGQRAHGFLSAVLGPEVWDQTEDLGGDSVDWGKLVPPGSNQAEDLESTPLERIDLKYDGREHSATHLARSLNLTSSWLRAVVTL